MDLALADETTGPIVRLRLVGGGYQAVIEPPLPTGNHGAWFSDKQSAWGYARNMASDWRLGMSDETRDATGKTR